MSKSHEVGERENIEPSMDHVNSVLRSIRNVNQLLFKADDRDKLIKGICNILTEITGYYHVWIALFDKSDNLLTTAQSGLDKEFQPLLDLLKDGELPNCAEKALNGRGVITTKNPSLSCEDCPLSDIDDGRSGLTIKFKHKDQVYGVLSASIAKKFVGEEEQLGLFKGVARDISFGYSR